MFSYDIKRRRGTTEEHKQFVGSLGEITVDTDKDTLVVHDGKTPGGNPLATHQEMMNFIGNDYFIQYNDLSAEVKELLDKYIELDTDYINDNFRNIHDKILFSDLEEEVKNQLILVSTIKLNLDQLKNNLSSSDENMGAHLIGIESDNENVRTVYDALRELYLYAKSQEGSITSCVNEITDINRRFLSFLENFNDYYVKEEIDLLLNKTQSNTRQVEEKFAFEYDSETESVRLIFK